MFENLVANVKLVLVIGKKNKETKYRTEEIVRQRWFKLSNIFRNEFQVTRYVKYVRSMRSLMMTS